MRHVGDLFAEIVGGRFLVLALPRILFRFLLGGCDAEHHAEHHGRPDSGLHFFSPRRIFSTPDRTSFAPCATST